MAKRNVLYFTLCIYFDSLEYPEKCELKKLIMQMPFFQKSRTGKRSVSEHSRITSHIRQGQSGNSSQLCSGCRR